MYLIFDTETTGLTTSKRWGAPFHTDNWICIQIAWQLHDDMGKVIEHQDYLVKPEGFNIPYEERIHGISGTAVDGWSVGCFREIQYRIRQSQIYCRSEFRF
jgi:DNA polymerase-3 subunit alpha